MTLPVRGRFPAEPAATRLLRSVFLMQSHATRAATFITAMLLAGLVLTASPAIAEPELKNPLETGAQFLASCQNEPEDPYAAIGLGVCLGFIQGIAAREEILPRTLRTFCLPGGTSWADTYDVVVAFLSAHPKNGNLPAVILTMSALRQSFPCRKE